MDITPEQYQIILRRDFHAFLQRGFAELNPATDFATNWHIEVMARGAGALPPGETKRLIVNLPPRSLKSHCASVAFVAWLLGHNPSAQIICASYAQDLADKHAIDCRALMNSGFYKEIFSTRLSQEKRAVADFLTTARGCRKATSVGGVLTGRGADFIVIDDPLQPDKALSDTRRNARERLVRQHAVQPPQSQARRLHHHRHAAPARRRSGGPRARHRARQGFDIEPKWKIAALPRHRRRGRAP